MKKNIALKDVNCTYSIYLVITFAADLKRTLLVNCVMKYSVKFIVMFVLLMLSFSMRGEAMNFQVLCDKHSADISYSTTEGLNSFAETTVETSNLSNAHSDGAYDKNGMQLWSFSDVELGFKSVSETYSFNSQRMRRAVELSGFFKGLLRGLCLREDLLVLDKCKSYHSDEDLYTAQSGCAYYVFALRRILI